MCGIVGYIGDRAAAPVLINGLKRLEYRGYDSAGIAVIGDNQLQVSKEKGKVSELANSLGSGVFGKASVGIGHTRWATHGAPSKRNAHPHVSEDIAVVHNGIIENYQELREQLIAKGHAFTSDTDSETIAHLIAEKLTTENDFEKAVIATLLELEGTFGIVVLNRKEPDTLIAARRGSPILLGVGDNEMMIASDATAIVEHTKKVVYLEDNEAAVIKADGYRLMDFNFSVRERETEELELASEAIEKAGYDHFLLKEIMEQPQTVNAILRGRLSTEEGTARLGGLNMTDKQLRDVERIVIVGCGTAFYAGALGKYLIEKMTRIPVDVEVASEFRYRNPVIAPNTVALFISQSGETADTLACVEEMKRRGVHTLGLVNVIGSTIARTVDGGIYLHAGPEISVASTKAFTNQVLGLLLFGLHVGRRRDLSIDEGKEVVAALEKLPDELKKVLAMHDEVKKVAKKISKFNNAIYLGRDLLYPIALEGALKLKEVSYLHAEAYPAGEVKHGPIALVDDQMLIVFMLGKGALVDKTISNIQEIKARGGTTLLITDTKKTEGKFTIHLTTTSSWTEPLLMNIVLQLLAYYVAVARGTDVDQPRNLAKSVTVE